MDYDSIRLGLTLINMLVTALVGVFVWQNKRHQVTNATIKENETHYKAAIDRLEDHMNSRLDDKYRRLNDIEDRQSTLKAHVSSLPSEAHILRLHTRLDAMTSGFNQDFQRMTLMLGDIGGKIEIMNKDRS